MKLTCKIFGHRWLIKSDTLVIDINGLKIPFTGERICSRCEKTEYKYAEWIDASLIPGVHKRLEEL